MNMNRWKNIFLIIHRASWIHAPVRVVFASTTIDTKIRLVKWLRVDNHITVRATGGMDQVVYLYPCNRNSDEITKGYVLISFYHY